MLERADKLLHVKNLAGSRTQAQKLIESNAVYANCQGWKLVERPSQKFLIDTEFKVNACHQLRYVSRAGLKLEAALKHLVSTGSLSGPAVSALRGLVALDIGQSTGGFTDCLLQHGAKRVVGVDVGHNQLVGQLKRHPHVTYLEGINARDMPSSLFAAYAPTGFDLIVLDVSFISQTKIIPNLANLLGTGGLFISLVKPQFEVGKKGIGKGGLVKLEYRGAAELEPVFECARRNGFRLNTVLQSPITGGDGNLEHLMMCERI